MREWSVEELCIDTWRLELTEACIEVSEEDQWTIFDPAKRLKNEEDRLL